MKTMKRLVVLLGLLGLVVALPLSHVVLAGPPAKVDICHLTANYEPSAPFVGPFGPTVLIANYGHVISVSPAAAEAHYAHGDPMPVFLTAFWSQFIPDFDNDSECVFWAPAP